VVVAALPAVVVGAEVGEDAAAELRVEMAGWLRERLRRLPRLHQLRRQGQLLLQPDQLQRPDRLPRRSSISRRVFRAARRFSPGPQTY
jgi:hypothetical protein